MKLLITDAHSPLGDALSHRLESEPFSLECPVDDVNWSDESSVFDYLQAQKPDILINTLAVQDFSVEQNATLERQVFLIDSARHIAAACSRLDIVPIHCSSYLVFGGDNKKAYDEADTPTPLCAQGRALLKAERYFTESVARSICLRLGYLVGSDGCNPLTRLLDSVLEGCEYELDGSWCVAPTSYFEVSRVLLAMLRQLQCDAENWGAMHYSSGDVCSELEFGLEVVARAKSLLAGGDTEKELSGHLLDGSFQDDSPVSADLGCRRCRDDFGVQSRSWRQGLDSILKAYLVRKGFL